LRRHLGTIGVVVGFAALGVFAVLAMSPGLLCRWTGRDCAASANAVFAPFAASIPRHSPEGDGASARKPAQTPRQAPLASNQVPERPAVRGEQANRLAAPDAADGHYLARSQAACGAKPTSVIVDVRSAEIAWRYEFDGIVYQWRGEIDADGAVRASVGGSDVFRASGRFTDAGREATMIYPDCPEGIAIRIVNKIPD
jgi:hypothetical protein